MRMSPVWRHGRQRRAGSPWQDNVRLGVAGVAGMGRTHLRAAPDVDGLRAHGPLRREPEAPREGGRRRPGTKAVRRPRRDVRVRRGRCRRPRDAELAARGERHARRSTPGCTCTARSRSPMTVGECRAIADLATRARDCELQVGFQHRFQHGYASAKRIVDRGELGPLQRAELRATDWFRPNVYFAARPWRATWAAAGGGVLMMQAIHQLDAFLWIAGMPSRVHARAWSGAPRRRGRGRRVRDARVPGRRDRHRSTASTLDPGRNQPHRAARRRRAHARRRRTRRASATWDDPTPKMHGERDEPVRGRRGVAGRTRTDRDDAMTFDDCVIACHRDFVDAIRTDASR